MNSNEPTDGVLVAKARQGDAAAFDALVRRHYRAAFGVALAVLGRRADAEDTCQDAWVRALEKLDECRQPDRFIAWLLQIVRNQARNQLDRRRVRAAEPSTRTTGPGREIPAGTTPAGASGRGWKRRWRNCLPSSGRSWSSTTCTGGSIATWPASSAFPR
jgi:DNA-directed RNA polymerase specialized sigma24 family protein